MRSIDKRRRPGVAGIDLEQALNYIEVSEAGIEFCYEHYTNSCLPYVRGARPELEAIADAAIRGCQAPLDKVQALASWVEKNLPWAGFYRKATGNPLPANRAMTEEQLIESGYGWCNEQARVFCCLTQVAGLPSRIVFAANMKEGYGHCTAEVLLPDGWMMVDPSFGYCFRMREKPVRAVDVFAEPACRNHFEPIYDDLCRSMGETIGTEKLCAMFRAENPLDGFTDIGFHNHFVR